MARTSTEATEFNARIADYQGVVRGKIPAPLVRAMGAQAGDYIVFRVTRLGHATVSVLRSGGSKKPVWKMAGRKRG